MPGKKKHYKTVKRTATYKNRPYDVRKVLIALAPIPGSPRAKIYGVKLNSRTSYGLLVTPTSKNNDG